MLYPDLLFMLPVGIFMFAAPVFSAFEVQSEHLYNQQHRLPEANVNRWFQRGLRVHKNCWANVICTSDMSKWWGGSHHSIWMCKNTMRKKGHEQSQVHTKSKQCSPDFPMDCYVFFISFLFPEVRLWLFFVTILRYQSYCCTTWFCAIFFGFADAFNSPRPCAGKPYMPCSAQPNPTGGGKDW